MADNASITILRNTQANINAEPIKDGNILFTTDQPSNEIYADVGAKRIKIGGGKGISNISKTGTSGLVDTYTITYNDGTTSTFEVTNGEGLQNLQVGGRNVLKGTKDFSGFALTGNSKIVLDYDGYSYCNVIDMWSNYFNQSLNKNILHPDVPYVISFYAKADKTSEYFSIKDDENNNLLCEVNINSTEWKKYSNVITFDSSKLIKDPNIIFFTRQNLTNIYVKAIKLELGNVPTDWSPALEDMFDVIRPVGSLYSTTDVNFNPNTATGWHGTWERIKDCVIYAAGDNDTVGSIVGSNTHTLTEAELPSHSHSIPSLSGWATGGNHKHSTLRHVWTQAGGYGSVTPTGSDSANQANTVEPENLIAESGSLTMSVTTNPCTTGTTGSGTAIDMRPRRLNSIVWRRIS